MDAEPASPRSKLLEQIYVRGSDTVIRISEDAVIVKTTREGGIKLPDDMEEAKPRQTTSEEASDITPSGANATSEESQGNAQSTRSEQLVADEDLNTLSQGIRDDWRSLALCHLNIPATDVESIMQRTSNPQEQIFAMLRLWKNREGKNATVGSLLAKLDKVVEKEKWEFLLQSDPNDGEEKPKENSALHETHENDSNADSDEEMLPPISLVNGGELNDVTPEEEIPLEHSEATANNTPEDLNLIIGEMKQNEDNTLEDIERLSAVYTGFAEEKKEQFTSIGASMGDILQKVLILDHENKKLKTRNAKLQQEKEFSDTKHASSQQKEHRKPQAACRNDSKKQGNPPKHTSENYQKQRENYLKVKGHLTEAIEANREWESFSRKKRDQYKKELNAKNTIIKNLEERVKLAESSASDQSRQMDSILNATENQASDMQKELERVSAERTELKERLRRVLEEKRQVEQLSKDLLKQRTRYGGKMETTMEQMQVENASRNVGQTSFFGSQGIYDVPSDSYQGVLQMVKSQAKPPPNDEYVAHRGRSEKLIKKSSKTAKPPSESKQDDDILFLKEQVLQYRKDFERERNDREVAAGELESLRRELDDTKLILELQRTEYEGKNAGAAAKYDVDRRDKHKPKKDRFLYMDPDQVESRRNQTDRNRDEVDFDMGGRYQWA